MFQCISHSNRAKRNKNYWCVRCSDLFQFVIFHWKEGGKTAQFVIYYSIVWNFVRVVFNKWNENVHCCRTYNEIGNKRKRQHFICCLKIGLFNCFHFHFNSKIIRIWFIHNRLYGNSRSKMKRQMVACQMAAQLWTIFEWFVVENCA